MTHRPTALALALAAAAAAGGCATHRRQVREFEEGRETAFYREQVAAARARAPGPAPLAGAAADRAPALEGLKDRWVRRAEERDDFEGILDFAAPGVREAHEAGATAEGAEAVLGRGPLALGTLRALVAARSPAVREAREAWRATVEQLDQAQWLEEVAASFRTFARDLDARVGGGGPGAPRDMVREFFPWPAAAALRGEMADLESAMARERARAALAAALAGAEESFAAAWEAGERARVLDGFLPALRAMAEVAASRYAAGRGSQDESLRVEAEIRWMESDLATAREQRTEAVARLNALLDRAPGASLPEPALPVVPAAAPAAPAVVARAASSPEAGVAARASDLARVAVRMAEVMKHPLPASAATPDARPGFGPPERAEPAGGMGMGPGGGAGGASRSMPGEIAPPWYGVEEAYLRELRRRAAAAEAARDAAARGAEAMAREAWRMLDTALRELRVAEGTAVPLAEQAFEVSRRDYASGSVTFADHLESWGALVRARLSALAARRMAVEARAAVLRATATWIEE